MFLIFFFLNCGFWEVVTSNTESERSDEDSFLCTCRHCACNKWVHECHKIYFWLHCTMKMYYIMFSLPLWIFRIPVLVSIFNLWCSMNVEGILAWNVQNSLQEPVYSSHTKVPSCICSLVKSKLSSNYRDLFVS